jgi:ribosomal protein L37E
LPALIVPITIDGVISRMFSMGWIMAKAKFVRCRDCGTNISARAKACPDCGAPTKPAWEIWFNRVWIAVTLLWLAMILFGDAPMKEGATRGLRNIAAFFQSLFVRNDPPARDGIAEELLRIQANPPVGDDGFIPVPPR